MVIVLNRPLLKCFIMYIYQYKQNEITTNTNKLLNFHSIQKKLVAILYKSESS